MIRMKNVLMKTAVLAIVALVMLSAVSCSANNGGRDDLITVNGKNIQYDLCRYFYCNYAAEYGEDELEGKADEIRSKTVGALRELYAPIILWEELGRSVNESSISYYVDEYIDEVVDSFGSKSTYRKQLSYNYLTEDVFEFLVKAQRISDLLFEEYIGGEGAANGKIDTSEDATRAAIESDDFIRIVQIMIRDDQGENAEDNRTLAKNLLSRAKNGEDFDSLISRYSDDFTMTPDGYYVARYTLNEKLEEAAFALKVGEISEVIELGGVRHIIKRLDKDPEYIEKHFIELQTEYFNSCFSKILFQTAASLEIVVSDGFNEADFVGSN